MLTAESWGEVTRNRSPPVKLEPGVVDATQCFLAPPGAQSLFFFFFLKKEGQKNQAPIVWRFMEALWAKWERKKILAIPFPNCFPLLCVYDLRNILN